MQKIVAAGSLLCLVTVCALVVHSAFLEARNSSGFSQQDSIQSSPFQSPPSDGHLLLRFGGDCLLAGYYEEAVGVSADSTFSGFDLLKTADIAMVNLECPITTQGHRIRKPYNFRMHPRFLSALMSAGIDVVNLANNHIYDYGKVGLFDTILYLDSVGIRHVGAGRNASEAHAPVILRLAGRSIAFLGYYGGGESRKATRKNGGVADRRINNIQSDIARIRKAEAHSFIIVNLHWGTEKATIPESNQVEFAHQVIDAGADLIIGHHPHVLQGIEKYKSGVIVYSLGNFIFGGNSRDTYDTALFEVYVDSDGPRYRLIPVRVERWQARELIGADAEKTLQHVKRLSGRFPLSIFTHKEVR